MGPFTCRRQADCSSGACHSWGVLPAAAASWRRAAQAFLHPRERIGQLDLNRFGHHHVRLDLAGKSVHGDLVVDLGDADVGQSTSIVARRPVGLDVGPRPTQA